MSWSDSTANIKIRVPGEYMYMVFALKNKHGVLETCFLQFTLHLQDPELLICSFSSSQSFPSYTWLIFFLSLFFFSLF